MEEPETLTAAEMAERMGITVEQLMEQARNGGSRPGPNRAQRREMERAGRKRGR